MIGSLFSIHKVKAVMSITLRLLEIHSAKEICSYRVAVGSFSGSAVYIPSTRVPFRITSAFISMARSEPAVDWVWDDMDADEDFYQDPNLSEYYLQGIAIFGEGEEGSVLFDLPIQLVERFAKPGEGARDRIKEVVKK